MHTRAWAISAGVAAIAFAGLVFGLARTGGPSRQPPWLRPSTGPVGPTLPTGKLTAGGAPIYAKELMSEVYELDRTYKSMRGPGSTQTFPLDTSGEAETLWITGFQAIVVDPDGELPRSQEYMCHSMLGLRSGALFTLSQGQQVIDLPEGFGIPVSSVDPLSLTTQVLNLNGASERVRHRVTVRFVKQKDLSGPMKPLFTVGATGLKLLEGDKAYFGVRDANAAQHGPGCLQGEKASEWEYASSFGRRFAAHWVVKPGREENHTLVTHMLKLPFDTTLHYATIHVHPFAESLELRDLTAGTSVFKATISQTEGKIGIAHTEHFSSAEGVPVYKDHEYELVSVYNNTTNVDQDSMAVMTAYLYDREFDTRSGSEALKWFNEVWRVFQLGS